MKLPRGVIWHRLGLIAAAAALCALLLLLTAESRAQGEPSPAARIADLERQLRELKASKGCAKLEVTEPPRNSVPKKERDS